MPKCKICIEREANQTGSHIIPHFLDKRIVNVDGDIGRDKELAFSISPEDQKFFIGRSVLPDQAKDLLSDLNEEQFENMDSLSTEDYIFCSRCEKLLGKLESDYSTTLSNAGDDHYISTKNGFLGTTFWLSIVFRLSVSSLNPAALKSKDEKKLRRYLAKIFEYNDYKEAQRAMTNFESHIAGYKLLRSIEFTEDHATYAFFHPKHQRPYCLIINEFSLFLFMKPTYQKSEIQDFFGLEKLHPKAKLNTLDKPERILSISHDDFQQVSRGLMEFFAEKKSRTNNYLLDGIFEKLFDRPMPYEVKVEFYRRYHSGETYGELKYSIEHFNKTLYYLIIDLTKPKE